MEAAIYSHHNLVVPPYPHHHHDADDPNAASPSHQAAPSPPCTATINHGLVIPSCQHTIPGRPERRNKRRRAQHGLEQIGKEGENEIGPEE
ncbi:hypothetical protein M0R45_002365 [Rubus argutus]|uniref:Uncharacterized protein n=1 Tax=Rubus argutus TaxID=59490 RepID=A0AAW1VJL8_RUBAR